MFLYSMRPYVIVGFVCVCVPGVSVLVKSGHRVFTRTGTPGRHTQPTIMTYSHILYKNITNVHPRNSA